MNQFDDSVPVAYRRTLRGACYMSMNKDLDRVRAAAQELHGAISDAAAKRSGAVKSDLEAVGQKAKAVTDLEAVQKHAAEAVKNSGPAFQASIRQTLADARASVQKVSEAVAAKRSAEST